MQHTATENQKFWETIPPEGLNLSKTVPITGSSYYTAKIEKRKCHMHYGLELGIVLSGSLRRYYPRAQMDIAPGQIWLCGIWEPHAWKILKIPCERVVLQVLPSLLASMLLEEAADFNWLLPFMAPADRRPQIHDKKEIKTILALAENIKSILAQPVAYRSLWLRLRLMEILMILCQQWSYSKSGNALSPNTFERIGRALELTFSSHNIVTTREAATACGMSSRSFSDLFERLMGMRYAEFDLRYRLGSAAADLRRSQEPIKIIALKWGFCDTSHFIHLFLHYYGCTPKSYRYAPA